MRIAVIGLGNMGLPMALNFLKAGFGVHGFDLRPERGAKLADLGGTPAASASDAASGADAVFLMVVSGGQAEMVVAAVSEELTPKTIVVAACTQAPASAKSLARKLADRGIAMLDAPVSGGVAGAEAATLTVMASGPREAFDRVRPALDAIGRNIFYLGVEAGQGSSAKMINQLLCGVHLAAAAEAMHVAEAFGLPLPEVHRMIALSAGDSWMWRDRGPRMMQAEPPVTSAVDIFVKDLGIVLDHGGAAALPLSREAHAMFAAASAQGHGRRDDSQVIMAYRALSSEHPAPANE